MKQRRLVFAPLLTVMLFGSSAFPQETTSSRPKGTKNTAASPQWSQAREQQLLTKARGGEARSQMWLASGYEQGWFGTIDFEKALTWFTKGAARGNADAQNELGRMYEDGEGVAQNYALAAKWYLRAAEHDPDFGGAGQGRNNLGLLYLNGHGVPQDFVQAYKWFRLKDEANVNLTFA